MKRTSANLKTLARESLTGNFALPVSAYLLITIVTSCFKYGCNRVFRCF